MILLQIFSRSYKKGQSTYIKEQTKNAIIRTICMFSLSLALFIIGYVTTKTNQNLLTVVAVLGCLPASKCVVEMIMFLKFKSIDSGLANCLSDASSNLTQAYDLVFTTYKVNYQLDHVVILDHTVYGFKEHANYSTSQLEQHIVEVLHLDGLKNIDIKVFTKKDEYLDRLSQLAEQKETKAMSEIENQILSTLLSVSL